MAPAEIVRTLGRLDEGQKELVRAQREGQKAVMDQLTLMRGEFIHRTEFDLQNRIVTNDMADVENAARDTKRVADERHEAVLAQVTALVSQVDKWKGWTAGVGAIIGVALGLLYAYIQAGGFK